MQRPTRAAAHLLGLSLAIACIGLNTQPAHAQDSPAPPEQPAAEQPAPEQPAADQPAAEQPAPQQPAPDQPAPDQPAPDQPAPETAPPAQVDVAALLGRPDLEPVQRMQLELLQLINQRRAEAGLPPLLLDQRLVAAAGEHSQDMAARRYCRHRGSDGSTARARMAKHGYPFSNWAGENIICSRKTAESAMKWWLQSRPHRKNILHGHFTHLGIGVDPNGPYGPMWTLNFAAGANDTVQPTVFEVANTAGEAGDPAEPPAGEGG